MGGADRTRPLSRGGIAAQKISIVMFVKKAELHLAQES